MSLDTTPAGLLKLADEADKLSRDYQGTDLGAYYQGKRDTLRALATSAPQERPLLGFARIYELLDEFGVTETDTLKYRLEDQQRWREDLLSGELVESQPVAPAVPDHAGLVKDVQRYDFGDADAFGRGEYMASADVLAALRPTGGETHE